MSIWSEIRQRRITQIVITYLAGGWMLLAVVDQVVDREVLPSVVYEVALTLYLAGIFAALIVGWFHGEKGEQRAPTVEIVLLVVVAIGGLGASAQVVRSSRVATDLRDAVAAGDLRSIAVLYLQDATAGGTIGPTVEGITEGLISELRQVSDLDVTSRNGSREVRGLDVGYDSIARILDVGALVDGSVDEVGGELRVSIRLLESGGSVLFRETFTWPSEEIASVGTELATEVTTALREQLGVEIRLREGQADAPNSAAWLHMARAERFLQEARESAAAGDAEGTVSAFAAAEDALDSAEESAPEWAGPLILRSEVEYEQFILAGSLDEAIAMMVESTEWADRALSLEPDSPGALERRGTARYRRWLYQAEAPEVLDQVFRQARGDLERSLNLDRTRASVNSTLSHLYYQTNDWPQAILAAREAYSQDAFLSAADGVLWRLYTASYDLGEYAGARDWCEEGNDRFPDNFRFVQCQIFLMTMPESEPAIGRAWELHEELVPLLVDRPQFFEAQSRLVVGGVIGRAGLPDSASAVFSSVSVPTSVDPDRELLAIEAAMRSVSGDTEGAISALQRYMIAQDRGSLDQHWWWDPIRSDPGFQALRARN